MSSPDIFDFKIDKKADTPIYLQITMHIINAVQRGMISSNAKLPGTRVLCEQLKVHRKTVVAAYHELALQGWITIIPNKGTFFNIHHKLETKKKIPLRFHSQLNEKPSFTLYKNTLLEPIEPNPRLQYAISDGLPDIRLCPVKEISSLYTAALKKNINKKYLGYDGSTNTLYCKQQLCNFLKKISGLNVRPQNLLITRSFETASFVAAATLLSKNDMVVVGNLSYYIANMIFQQVGAKLVAVPVDAEGLNVDAIEEICKYKKIRMVHVMPSQHYPTTVSLSAHRRVKLLYLSKKYDFIILEDEYEYEFNFDSSIYSSLISADAGNTIVHIGSFGKSLPPEFRASFLIAATKVITEMDKYLSIINRQGNPLTELVLAQYIAEGNAYRHQKKSQKIYKEKRDYFIQIIKKNLSKYVDFVVPLSGLAIWITFKKHINLFQLSEHCKAKNLWLPKFLLYQNTNTCAIRIGFGDLNEPEMKKIISILLWAVHQQN